MSADISIHGVRAVELQTKFVSNSHQRTIMIKTDKGDFNLVLFGEGAAMADVLPRAKNFKDADESESAA
jgi:hypothetical protein